MSTYTFRKQVDNKGFYVAIDLEAIVESQHSLRLSVDYLADPQWEPLCRAGITLFYDYFKRFSMESLRVKVIDIKWMPIDTNGLIVLFGTVQALSEALNIPIEGLQFDHVNQSFVFPDRRSVNRR